MRDNGSEGSSSGGAHIKPVDWIRTESQLKSFESFTPEFIEVREPMGLTTADGRTMQLAQPPKWTHRDDLPCTQRVPKGHGRDPYDESDEKKAKALCAGCPVRQTCLNEALEVERDEQGRPLGERSRYLVRGGLTPKGRAELTSAD